MKLSLYDISSQYVEALEKLDALDLPEEAIADTLEGLKGELQEKCQNVAAYNENILALANAKKMAAKRLSEQAKAIESKSARLVNYLDQNMKKAGISEISCDLFTIKYKKNPPSVEIDDESKIDRKYINKKVTVSPDKAAIKKAIQEGKTITGARIIQGQRLVIV